MEDSFKSPLHGGPVMNSLYYVVIFGILVSLATTFMVRIANIRGMSVEFPTLTKFLKRTPFIGLGLAIVSWFPGWLFFALSWEPLAFAIACYMYLQFEMELGHLWKFTARRQHMRGPEDMV
jgi:hypothetical protein